MEPDTRDVDVVVIGGGPAGSTVSTLMAMQGRDVLLLERDVVPRWRIGESLLPSTIHGICRLLGVFEKIESAGFMRKLGGTFRWGASPKPWTFTFATSPRMAGPTSYAYQVERAKFDAILLDNAREKGVDVRLRHSVEDVIHEGDRVAGVRYTDPDGGEHQVRARYVIDAAGHQSRLHRLAGERVYSQYFQNVAVFGYFEGGKRMPAPNDGNILCAAFDEGWFWYIPLSPTLTSVGAVVTADKGKDLRGGHEQALMGYIDRCPLIAEYLADATRVTEGMYGEVRVRKDWSYSNTSFSAPGLILVGDSACFIDPVFSSGVHLATYSALLAARTVNSVLDGTADEDRALREFEARYRKEFALFHDFLVAFYNMHKDESSYFWKAKQVSKSEASDLQAFVELVGGVSSNEGVFGQGDLLDRIGAVEGELQDRVIEPTGDEQLTMSPVVGEVFGAGATVQMQALTSRTGRDTPVAEEGLVVSADGLHWVDPEVTVGAGGR